MILILFSFYPNIVIVAVIVKFVRIFNVHWSVFVDCDYFRIVLLHRTIVHCTGHDRIPTGIRNANKTAVAWKLQQRQIK